MVGEPFRAAAIKISPFFDVFHVDVTAQGSGAGKDRLRFFGFKSLTFVVVAAGRFLLSYIPLLGSGSWKMLQRD